MFRAEWSKLKTELNLIRHVKNEKKRKSYRWSEMYLNVIAVDL